MTAAPPLLGSTGSAAADRAAACAAVTAEDRGLDLSGAADLDQDDENRVLRTVDGWILRFPRRAEPDVAREAAVLAQLDGRLLVDTPQHVWTGRLCRLIAYRQVAGAAFDADAYAAADGRRRNRLAASIARFLVVMHTALSAAEMTELGVPTADPDALAARVAGRLDDVPGPLRDRASDVVAHFREAWVAEPRPVRHVVLHGGLHAGTMTLSDPVGELTGVSGFSRVQLGPPSLDLRYLAREPAGAPPGVCRDLMQRVADQYGRTGITLDVDGARAAMAMADLDLAIASGDFRRFTPDDGVWAWPGADRG